MRRQAVLIALVLALSVFGGSAVEGSPITYYFGGTVSGAAGSFSDLRGTLFDGWFIYDPPPSGSLGYGMAPGAFALTTDFGTSVSTGGTVFVGLWSISSSAAMYVDPLFDVTSLFSRASVTLRGPWGSADPFGPAPPPFPPDLSGWSWTIRRPEVYSRESSAPGAAELMVGCVSTNVGGCGASPVPEPASLLLLGTGLVGLRAWRKRRA